ncbi:MAG: type II toxin-antitoxin system VapC family toxin [Terriglobales bacterium]
MSYLLDTQLLLWAVLDPSRMPAAAWALLNDGRPPLCFSVGSIWEAGIKFNRRHRQLAVDPELLRGQLIEHDYRELAILGEHAVAAAMLPLLHKDPFDRILVAQATLAGITLLTTDARLARYPGPIRLV